MDSSRTRTATLVYWLGIVTPVLMVVALKLIERSGTKQSVGVGWIALVSLIVCAIGAFLSTATVKKKVMLILIAAIVIPIELLALAVLFLTSGGLSGTQ